MRFYIGILILLTGVLSTELSAQNLKPALPGKSDEKIYYLFRHGEKSPHHKAVNPEDPLLNRAGQRRAKELARVLKNEPVTAIFSTDYHRTRDTVKPLAKKNNLSVRLYDPKYEHLIQFANKLKAMSGRIVVSGHSNSTLNLVKLMGGDTGPPIDEDNEFDRLYILVIEKDGTVHTMLLRYGE